MSRVYKHGHMDSMHSLKPENLTFLITLRRTEINGGRNRRLVLITTGLGGTQKLSTFKHVLGFISSMGRTYILCV